MSKKVLLLVPEGGSHSNADARRALLQELCKELRAEFACKRFVPPQPGKLSSVPEGISNYPLCVFQGLMPSWVLAYDLSGILPIKVALITGANLFFEEDRGRYGLPADFLEKVSVLYAPDNITGACRQAIFNKLAELIRSLQEVR